KLSWWHPEWDGSRIQEYQIYWGFDTSCPNLLARVESDVTVYEDGGLMNGLTYYYTIKSVNTKGDSAFPNPVLATPLGPPPPPRDLKGYSRSGYIQLNWTEPITNGGYPLLGYRVYRSPSWHVRNMIENGPNETGLHDSRLEVGVDYTYVIYAFNEKGISDSTQITLRARVSRPSAPQNLTFSELDTGVTLRWDPPAFDGGSDIVRYRIYRGLSPSLEELAWCHTAQASKTSKTDYDLENGVTYYFMVAADNGAYIGDPSAIVEATPFGAPSEPLNLSLSTTPGTIHMVWEMPANDGGRPMARYHIYWGSPETNLTLLVSVDTTETSFTKTGLENGRVYSFQVSAENLGGIEGPRCYEMPIRPCGLPGKASTLNLEEDMDRVLVMWDVPTETGGTDYFRYNILRGTSPSYLELIEELIETTEYLDWNITFGQRYYYSVLVWNDAGWGPECDPLDILVITGPGLVGNFKVEPHDGYVRLSWDEPGFDGGKVVSEYKIIRGYNKFELERTVNITNLRENEDHTVENNRLYWYAIVAKNDDQWGVNCSPLSVTPLSRPGKVSNFRVIVVDEHIVLSWLDPSVDGCFPITGYKVKRGTSPGDLQDYDTVGLENTYRDVAV
ncbi:MAG: fibronectin type III domain-containing protein, partial [Thermoplasmata archaeon]|nr:fibronectin type III domain-containing protein [Thermoplasmata archaeon]